MSKIPASNDATHARESQEILALKAAVASAVVFGLLSLIVGIGQTNLPVSGWHSFGWPMIAAAISLPLGLFNYGYQRRRRLLSASEAALLPQGWRSYLDGATLSVAYTIVFGGITIVLLSLINTAFAGLELDRYTCAVLDAIFAGWIAHTIIDVSMDISSKQIIQVLSVFLTSGVLVSMVTNSNSRWWQANFSSLGEFHSNTFLTFNLTLILSGLMILALADHLLIDIREVIPGQRSYRLLRWFFRIIGLCLLGVGLFPDSGVLQRLHYYSAYATILVFVLLIGAIPWLLPGFTRAFYRTSYGIIAIIVALFWLYQYVHYFSLTAFELLSFLACFSWMYLLFKTLDARRQDGLNGRLSDQT